MSQREVPSPQDGRECVIVPAAQAHRLAAMTAFAGLDLAWTTTHPSGVCVLETIGGTARLVEIASQITPVEVLAADMRDLGPDSIVAVDAPLIRRDGCMAERELGRVFGRFHASAYMASMAFLESRKPPLDAGPRLGDALSGVGFTLDPLLVLAGGGGRRAFEMYPHAFHVAAFGLDERILYKKAAERRGWPGWHGTRRSSERCWTIGRRR